MAAAIISNNDFYKITNILRETPAFLASNYSKFVSKHYPGMDCYSVITIDKNKNRLIGSVSWETSGFDFEIYFEKQADKSLMMSYLKVAHTGGWTAKDDTNSDDIIEKFIRQASDKIDDVIAGTSTDWNGGRLNGYFFRKKPSETAPTSTFNTNLNELLSNKKITKKFHDFIKLHEKRIVIAKHL